MDSNINNTNIYITDENIISDIKEANSRLISNIDAVELNETSGLVNAYSFPRVAEEAKSIYWREKGYESRLLSLHRNSYPTLLEAFNHYSKESLGKKTGILMLHTSYLYNINPKPIYLFERLEMDKSPENNKDCSFSGFTSFKIGTETFKLLNEYSTINAYLIYNIINLGFLLKKDESIEYVFYSENEEDN